MTDTSRIWDLIAWFMLNDYSGEKLRNLRKRALLTQMQVVEITGISETTIHYLEHDLRRPQSGTLDKLLNLYAIRIQRLEHMERIFGENGKKESVKENHAERSFDSEAPQWARVR